MMTQMPLVFFLVWEEPRPGVSLGDSGPAASRGSHAPVVVGRAFGGAADGGCSPEDRMLDFIVLDAKGDGIVVYYVPSTFLLFLLLTLPFCCVISLAFIRNPVFSFLRRFKLFFSN